MYQIALFGPPGIGKSTIIRKLRNRMIKAFDFETVGSTKQERIDAFSNSVSSNIIFNVIGAADLDPDLVSKHYACYLLTLAEKDYESRRKKRDLEKPFKKEQPEHSIHEWIKLYNWKGLIEADDNVIDTIIQLIK